MQCGLAEEETRIVENQLTTPLLVAYVAYVFTLLIETYFH